MRKIRKISAAVALLSMAGVASAQFDGPAPVAWRWVPNVQGVSAGAPLVVKDTIFDAVGGRIYSVEKQTGNLKWRFPALDAINGSFKAAPLPISDDLLVAVGDNKMAYGIDPVSGESKWTSVLPGAVTGQPVQAGKFVIVALTDNTLYAFDPLTGKAVWTQPYKMNDGIEGALGSYQEDLLVFSGRDTLYSINPSNNRVDWSQKFDQVPPGAKPVVFGDSIYVNSGGFLVSLLGSTGLPRWEIPTNQQLIFSPAVSATGILVVTNDGKAIVYGPDKSLITRQPIELGSTPIVQPTAVGDKFIVATANGAINLIDPKTSSIIWSYIVPLISEGASQSKTGGYPGGPGGGFPGGPGGFPGGPGGFQGGGGGPQGSGGRGQGPGGLNRNKGAVEQAIYVQASASAVLAGTTLLVPERDGSLIAFDKDLGVDLTAPTVKLLFPNPGDQVSGQPPLLLMLHIEDQASGVNMKTLKITCSGDELKYEYDPKDGNVYVRFSTSTANKKRNAPLTDGRKDVLVEVSDWMGNTSAQHFSLTIDNTLQPVTLPGSSTTQPGGPGRPGGFGGPGGGGGGK